MTGHGGNIYEAAGALGISAEDVIDFSASINPLGLPKSALAAIKNSSYAVVHYPEPFAASLSFKIAEHYGLSPESVICGNGSTELIYLIPRVLKPKRVLLTAPTFSEYEQACINALHTEFSYLFLNAENRFDIDAADYIKHMKGHDLAFLCNPNNPTGRLMARKDVMKIASAAKNNRCYLVVDEAFMDFCPGESLIKAVRDNPYLIVLRSLTKFYAMAGLRLGFGVFHPELAGRLKAYKEPWSVNALAALAGKAAIGDNKYQNSSLKYMEREKKFLEKNLKRLGIEYIPSSANYYLLMLNKAGRIIKQLSSRGLLLRDCSNFRGLGDGFVRISVRTRKENRLLIRELSTL